MLKITNLWILSSIGHRTCEIIRKKHPCHTKLWAFRWLISRPELFLIWGLEIKFVENYFFLENYDTLEGAVSHNTVNLSPLLVIKKSFFYNNYFEKWPSVTKLIVSTAFKEWLRRREMQKVLSFLNQRVKRAWLERHFNQVIPSDSNTWLSPMVFICPFSYLQIRLSGTYAPGRIPYWLHNSIEDAVK